MTFTFPAEVTSWSHVSARVEFSPRGADVTAQTFEVRNHPIPPGLISQNVPLSSPNARVRQGSPSLHRAPSRSRLCDLCSTERVSMTFMPLQTVHPPRNFLCSLYGLRKNLPPSTLSLMMAMSLRLLQSLLDSTIFPSRSGPEFQMFLAPGSLFHGSHPVPSNIMSSSEDIRLASLSRNGTLVQPLFFLSY